LNLKGTPMISPRVFSLIFAALACSSAAADPVYKSVDSAGNVTYSSTPPKGGKAEKVDVPPPPTEAETQQAEERKKKAEEMSSEMEAQRREKEAAQAAKEAEEARLREAQKPPVVIETPVYAPQPYYPPSDGRYPVLPPARPLPMPR
jgi:hypothetical protein